MASPDGRDREFDDAIVTCGRTDAAAAELRFVSDPRLAALRAAGTTHVYADTADVDELRALVERAPGAHVAEIDGNTANQPLVAKVVDRLLESEELAACARGLVERARDLPRGELAPVLYAILCGRLGCELVAALAGTRAWEVSLQLHMGLGDDPGHAARLAACIRRMVPTAFVKVPFTPDVPACLLLARDLERAGIPVNLTSTFSARQVAVGALLADVTRTNVFMGRLNQGLEAARLGEHVCLEAQRTLIALRRDARVKTALIVASMREWDAFVRLAGCDVFTAPCDVLAAFLEQEGEVASQLETSYADDLGVAPAVREALGDERIGRLYRVEPELVAFLTELRGSPEWDDLEDGESLRRRFESAGFGDVFYAPDDAERAALRKSKLPDVGAPLTGRVALDTLYSLLANADFAKTQEEIDGKVSAFVSRSLRAHPEREVEAR